MIVSTATIPAQAPEDAKLERFGGYDVSTWWRAHDSCPAGYEVRQEGKLLSIGVCCDARRRQACIAEAIGLDVLERHGWEHVPHREGSR